VPHGEARHVSVEREARRIAIENLFRTAGQTKQALAGAAKQVDDFLTDLKTKIMNSAGKTINEVLL